MARNEIVSKQDLEGLPPWLAAMRRAAMEGVTEKDVTDIVAHQIALAKKGDHKAIKFVFDQVLGGNQLKGATFIQNNTYGDAPDATKPTKHAPGSNGKIETMRRRLNAGVPLTRSDDGPNVTLD